MAGRKFRLQQVLEHRRQVEQQKQQELAGLARQRSLADEAMQLLQRQAAEVQRALGEQAERYVDVAKLQATRSYLEAVEGSIARQRATVDGIEEQVLQSRDELVEILKEKNMLEQLESKHAAGLAADRDRRESRETDDLTSARFVRRQREAA